jgi:NitT/TauT family transport system permease protein
VSAPRELSMKPMAVPRSAVRRSPGRLRRLLGSTTVARVLSWVCFLVAWQVAIPLLPTLLLPTPAEVGEFMWDELRGDTLAPQTVYQAFGVSLERLSIGLLIAFAIGIPIGLLIGLSRAANWFLHDFVVVGLAMPSLVWALIAAMWFGFGSTAPIVTVVLAAVTFVIINIAEGVRNVPKDLLDMSRAYTVGRRDAIRHVVFPSLMPFFFAALRYGLANAWKGLVLAELFASTNGAGWTIKFWYDAHRAQGIIGYALFFILFALLVERLVFGRLSAYVFRWRPPATR